MPPSYKLLLEGDIYSFVFNDSFFRNTFFFFDNSFCKAKKYPFFLKFVDFDFLLLLFFYTFKSLQNENFAVLSERFSAREKSLGRNDSFLFFKLNYEISNCLLERERKMPQKAGATEESNETKEKAAAVQTRNKVPCFVTVSRSRCFYLFLFVGVLVGQSIDQAAEKVKQKSELLLQKMKRRRAEKCVRFLG